MWSRQGTLLTSLGMALLLIGSNPGLLRLTRYAVKRDK